jgi:hypothetical protein
MAPSGAEGRARARLERFLFAPVSPPSAAVFRATLPVVLAIVFWPVGDRPGQLAEGLPGLAFLFDHLVLSPPYWLLIVTGLALLGLGWRPRAVGFALVALLLPLALLQRAQLSRQVMLVTLLAFSLVRSDAQHNLRTWRGGQRGRSAGPIWPIRLIQLQLSALYAVNALAKTTPAYLSGEVLVGMSIMLPNFRLDLSDRVQQVGPLLLPVWLLASGSTVIEWLLAIGFWFPPLRVGVALLGLAFHLAARFVVNIYALDLVSVCLYLAFLLPFGRAPVSAAQAGRPGPRPDSRAGSIAGAAGR